MNIFNIALQIKLRLYYHYQNKILPFKADENKNYFNASNEILGYLKYI